MDSWSDHTPLAKTSPCCMDREYCPKCGQSCFCESHDEVHNGIGVVKGNQLYLCPVHGEFFFGKDGPIFRDESAGEACAECALRALSDQELEFHWNKKIADEQQHSEWLVRQHKNLLDAIELLFVAALRGVQKTYTTQQVIQIDAQFEIPFEMVERLIHGLPPEAVKRLRLR